MHKNRVHVCFDVCVPVHGRRSLTFATVPDSLLARGAVMNAPTPTLGLNSDAPTVAFSED